MGSCCCKQHESLIHEILDGHRTAIRGRAEESRNGRKSYRFQTDALVLEALTALRKLADDDDEPPECMTILHSMAEEDEGWLSVVKSCIFAIPLEDSLGSAVVSLLLDECPLPTRDAIDKLISHLDLHKDSKMLVFHTKAEKREGPMVPSVCRNLAVVLGCLAEKLAGPSSVTLLTKGTLNFLLNKLRVNEHPAVVLYTILALEKFAQTSENKLSIRESGVAQKLEVLEKELLHSSDHLKHQAGFCAQWALDNIFSYEGRPYSYQKIDVSHINAMLNNNDASDYLKISPTGLEARCDATSFESVRCTFCVEEGVWYYEVTILTAGVMQIGWATKDSKFLNHEGYGIGDDEFSCAYDGCRQLIWYAAKSYPHEHPPWKAGDVLGLLLDLEEGKVVFTLNGKPIMRDFPAARDKRPGSGFFAAASFMSFQHCLFNFGSESFMYPPTVPFKSFNDNARMSAEERVILPRHQKLAVIRQESISGDPCRICYEKAADTRLEPCTHREMCMRCAALMDDCPICRQPIVERVLEGYTSTPLLELSSPPSEPTSPS